MRKGCLIALGTPVGLVILVISLFWLNYYNLHVRYRLTVEIQDGNQVKTGSSVIDVAYIIDPGWIWEGPNSRPGSVTGYAPTIDLGEKGLLFLTFVNPTRTPEERIARNEQFFCGFDDMWCLPFAAYGQPHTGVNLSRENRKVAVGALLHQSGPREVPLAVLPKLVRFLDINDPLTSVRVLPNNLAAAFGPSVSLKRVVLQLTDDPVTPPPQNWPQWLTVRRQHTEFRGYESN